MLNLRSRRGLTRGYGLGLARLAYGMDGDLLDVLIIALVWLLTRAGMTSAPPAPPGRESPEEILKRRYASGEINPDDYKRMLNEIRR